MKLNFDQWVREQRGKDAGDTAEGCRAVDVLVHESGVDQLVEKELYVR